MRGTSVLYTVGDTNFVPSKSNNIGQRSVLILIHMWAMVSPPRRHGLAPALGRQAYQLPTINYM